MKSEPPYNPLDKLNLGVSVTDALLAKPVEPLPPAESFIGAGIYAIYYTGAYPDYEPIAVKNRNNQFESPIYVGKAVPKGSRKGGLGLDVNLGTALYKRLTEHGESVRQARNLELKDFFCRYLVVDDIWIPLGESLLVESFSPLWNKQIDGFGNHDPGGGRKDQQRSPWDVLHPGRPWAEKLKPCRKAENQLLDDVRKFLKARD